MFRKQYFSILFWKSLVYLMGVFSLLIVTPQLTSQPKIFGIYAFCASIIIFFSYADLGFITAARKFAAEHVAKKQLRSEIAVTAFSCLIFLIFAIPISSIILYFSFNPHIIISDLVDPAERQIASSLLLVLALSFPVLILQRVVQIIYSVRLEDYHVFKFEIASIVLKIVSVFYFFQGERYRIIDYFIFINVLNLVNLCVLCFLARKRYQYDFIFFLKSLRYRKSIYEKVSPLAFSSLFVSFAWLLFYEVDLILITTLSGAMAAAYYAVAFNVVNIIRNLLGTLYYPFTVRFNHLLVQDRAQLKSLYSNILKLGAYIVIPGLAVIFMFSKPLIVSWVGGDFLPSVLILQLLVLSYLFYPVNTPTGALLTTKLQLKVLYLSSLLMVIIQYAGLAIFYQSMDAGLLLASLKFLCVGTSCMLLINWAVRYLGTSWGRFLLTHLLFPILVSLAVVLTGIDIIENITVEQGLLSLFTTALFVVLAYIVIIGFLFLLDKSFRNALIAVLKNR